MMFDWNLLMWVGLALILILAMGFAGTAGRASRVGKPPGGGMGAFGVIDDLFHPAAKETRMIREEQALHRAPLPSPHDKPFNEQSIVIELPTEPDGEHTTR